MPTFARMAILGLKELRLLLRPIVFTRSSGRHHHQSPPHRLTDKVALHNFLRQVVGSEFRYPKIDVIGTRSPVLGFAAGQEKGGQRWQGQGHGERASMRTHWYGFYAAQVSPTYASVNQSITV